MFKGSSLSNVRILYGFSRKQLAGKVGVTEQAIWQFENGYTTPKLEVVNCLKKLFNVKSTYFYMDDIVIKKGIKNSIDPSHIAYRSEVMNSVKKSQSESMHVTFLDAFLYTIEERIKYPKNTFVELRDETIAYLQKNKDMPRKKQIQKIAMNAREKLGLADENNEHLLYFLEKSGCFIFEKEIGEDIDAYSVWSNDDRAYILLGNIKKTSVRRNFDLAHELGHLLMHHKVEFTMQENDGYKELEEEANLFASEFLLPREHFIKDFLLLTKRSNPDAYLEIKKKWCVSIQAIAVRAMQLELISYQQYRYFFISINRKGYKYVEPLDEVIPLHTPTKVKSILQLLFEKNIMSLTSLTENLRVDEQFLIMLTGIEPDFFYAYAEQEPKQFSVANLEVEHA